MFFSARTDFVAVNNMNLTTDIYGHDYLALSVRLYVYIMEPRARRLRRRPGLLCAGLSAHDEKANTQNLPRLHQTRT